MDDLTNLANALGRIAAKLPKSLRHRLQNTLEHFERSGRLFEVDREMASFRAITGEEEAATALIRAIHIRKYEGADRLNALRHHHKAAVVACVMAVGESLRPLLAEFQLQFDFQKGRIDLKIPLSNFNVRGGEKLAIQPVEPLGLLHSRPGVPEGETFDAHLLSLAGTPDVKDLRKLVEKRANQRNTLLYASDDGLPKSRATQESIDHRRNLALAMLVVTVMVYQSRTHHHLIRQSLSSLVKVL